MDDERLAELRSERDRLAGEIAATEEALAQLRQQAAIVDGRIDEREQVLVQMPVAGRRRDLQGLIAAERANGLMPAEIAKKLGIKLARVMRHGPHEGEAG
jgi:hypothetical protein